MKKKAVILLAGLFALLGAACLSMARVMHGEEYVAAARAQSLYKLDIAQSRGTIYDCGLQPLVGGETEYVAAVAPTIQPLAPWKRPPAASTGSSWPWPWRTAGPSSWCWSSRWTTPWCRCSGCPAVQPGAAGRLAGK